MNFKISGTIRVHVIGSGFVSLESSLWWNGKTETFSDKKTPLACKKPPHKA